MSNLESSLDRGSLTVSDDVIAAYVNEAVLKTEGVNDLYAGLSDTLSKNILGKYSIYKGLKVSTDEDGYSIDIYLIVDYGVKIPAIAWDVQKNVIHELEDVMTIEVKDVNIHIQGVALPKKDKDKDKDQYEDTNKYEYKNEDNDKGSTDEQE